MKVYVTQRIDYFGSYKERRDSLDMKWCDFFYKVGITPVFIPNHLEAASKIMSEIGANGLLLTGGNTLGHLEGGDAPERDVVETYLVEKCLNMCIPIIGVCRGMQFLHHFWW